MDRPITSKSRGTCKYYKEPRGCFAGSKCKFLHGESNSRGLTPYDQAKTCRFYAQGYCKRGDECWFKHTPRLPSPGVDDEDEPCSICFEQPVTYGLLMGCSHVFCISCIKQWRDSSKLNRDPGPSKVTKQCPMCRAPSAYITPSSVFYKNEDPRKEKAIISYKESMARVPCRYFQASKREDASNPFCPFGKDCFYQHLNDDGTPHIFNQGIEACMKVRCVIRQSDQTPNKLQIYARRRARPTNGFPFPGRYPDPVEMIGLFMDTMDNHFSDMGTFEGTYDLMRTELRRMGFDSDDVPIGLPPAAAVSRYIGDLLRPGGPRRPPVSVSSHCGLQWLPTKSQSWTGRDYAEP
ncbi:hypothetical protein EDD18DRAFT_1073041 [Armillaria luteobubalina]|uniref:RING-type E3 ubiquitin transferase n=1 Tax=Armillaria luteobubalina TaxID=153913 RepID=A0AA39Q6F9_9AGAR|nr:hypothetical protein EDD18DRAFT_1073041 [Armillaria luteobubalina]